MTDVDLGTQTALPARRTLAQELARQLLTLIENGTLKKGDRMPSESQLRERFGVGRSTVREALNGLVLLGVIDVRHGQGAVVLRNRGMGMAGLEEALRKGPTGDLLEAREAMELTVARRAAERATEEDLARVADLLDRAEGRVAAEGSAIEEAADFHLVLAEAAHNELFERFLQMVLDQMTAWGEELFRSPGYPEWELRAHRIVFDAVASGDGERAQRAMARHLGDMRAILRDGWAASRARFEEDRA